MAKKILVVDDNHDTVQILSVLLKRAGFLVTSAGDGVEAMEKIKQERPSLILLDVMMPQMDGFEVCRAIKSDSETDRIPVLMVTAKADPLSRNRCVEMGANDYLTKPINPTEIVWKVKQYLTDDPPPPPSPPKAPLSPLFLFRQMLDLWKPYLGPEWAVLTSGDGTAGYLRDGSIGS